MSEENQALFRRFIDDVMKNKNVNAIDGLLAPDYIEHNPIPGQPPGLDAMKEFMGMFFAAFPDLDSTIDLLVAEGDIVAGRMTTTGTHTGDFMGIPATGKRVSYTETHIVRIANGIAVEHWGNQDDMAMMQQLGVIPEG
jgi:predicted ester cyclase